MKILNINGGLTECTGVWFTHAQANSDNDGIAYRNHVYSCGHQCNFFVVMRGTTHDVVHYDVVHFYYGG